MKKQLGYKYLFKNIGLLTLSSFATRFLAFFLVPLYTKVITTTEYGIYDLLNTTIGILLPILTLNIQDAVIRFLLDKKMNRNSIAVIGIKYLLISNFLVIMCLIINNIFEISLIIRKYSFIFFLIFFVQSFSSIIISYIRGIDKVLELSISSILASIVTIICNIVFLLIFKWGLNGYFWANIIGPFIQCIYLTICSKILKYTKYKEYKKEEKEMLVYSKPLVVNNIIWWINNVADRYIIIFFCGFAENGLYSISGKIPSILTTLQIIFNQAWILSVVKEFDTEDSTGFFSDTYKMYNCMLVIICSSIIFFNKLLAEFLYAKDFYLAWKYVPWLTIAIIFGGLSGYIGAFFSAAKNSKIFASSTIIGAIINLILNFMTIPFYGAIGAAIATMISYLMIWIFRIYHSRKYINLKINLKKDIISYIFLIIQSIFTIFFNGLQMYLYSGMIFIIICLLYISELRIFLRRVIRK